MKKILKLAILVLVVGIAVIGLKKPVDAKDSEGNIVIVIDPGHGGEDPGTIGITGVYESKCNFTIAEAMKDELAKYKGVKVYLTREDNTWMTNAGRAIIAADLKADFLISVHNNGGSDTNTGSLAFRSLNSYYSEATNDMCTKILDNLAELGLKNGGVQTRTSTTYDYEDYYTLIGEGVRAGVPSIIVEHCFLSNPSDAALVSNEDGSIKTEMLEKMGVANANAVVSYFNLAKNSVVAEDNKTVELEKGYSVVASAPSDSANVSWFSTNQNVATVDTTGIVKAVGSGTANVVYKLSDGTEGTLTVVVKEPIAISLTGGIDPTFYQTDDEFKKIDLASAFAYVIYSDGSAKKVTPDNVGSVDFAKVGIQDIEISYNDMKGRLRVCHNTESYVPTVTLPAEEETTKEEVTTSTEDVTTVAPVEKTEKKTSGFIKDFGIYIIVVAVLVGIGIGIVVLEKKKRSKYKNRSRKHL